MDEAQLTSLFASTLRVSTPLIFCALAGLLSERSGVIDLGLEGKMLLSAFAAGAAGAVTGSLTLALATALLVGLAMSMLHGYACVSHRGDQVVLGIALTMTAAGLSIVLGIAWFKQGGQTPPLPDTVRVGPWWLGHNALVYLALAMVPAIWFLLYRTTLGLRLRATGENPAMVDAAGLSVKALRYGALACNGLLCGLAGSYLVLAQGANFSPHMTAGRGYMALAAMIFGKWHPLGALGACILFGFLDAVAIRLQGVPLPPELGGGAVPVQAIQALPYLMTVILLAGFMGHARAPAALGIPYVKER
ncbi:MAG: ABC transporter permease [Betaproteobacteria bacterium]|nr:ABC transporter permease [Betaproteobacteria bacterium]